MLAINIVTLIMNFMDRDKQKEMIEGVLNAASKKHEKQVGQLTMCQQLEALKLAESDNTEWFDESEVEAKDHRKVATRIKRMPTDDEGKSRVYRIQVGLAFGSNSVGADPTTTFVYDYAEVRFASTDPEDMKRAELVHFPGEKAENTIETNSPHYEQIRYTIGKAYETHSAGAAT